MKIDGLAFQTCNVKPAVVSPPPHAHAFLFFAYEGNALRGRGEPAPSSISPSVQPLCRLCAFDNQALSEVTCCLLCHTLFCSNHGGACDQCSPVDLCAACLLHHVCLRPDVVGGAADFPWIYGAGHFCRYLPMDTCGEPMAPKFLKSYNAAVWYFRRIHNGDLEVLLTSFNEHPALPADLLGHILLFEWRLPRDLGAFCSIGGHLIACPAELQDTLGLPEIGNGQNILVWNIHPCQHTAVQLRTY